ncbi:amino acid ABC transporter permease [Roseospira marina]|uniref:Amino acid ABC transporter permease n=1 Tax=Roseospira marina TaxID=140057 RepID=A0A5M6IBA0_9PROT|nr:amino acid ABC transporter permease [Roseospira marina]KAA5604999.1 amino acid ABC transporter permease [Roseospira marina]MBB4314995.1 general L-amino acid transport system permease protein [Roseospira marina]MBB5087995.1 general L-amino acid transport system permease protein [Roseospira marina]
MSSRDSESQVFTPRPALPPPPRTVGLAGWARQNLFSSIPNTLLTLLSAYLVWVLVPPVIDWAILSANFFGDSNDACTGEGACWVFIGQRLNFFIYGFYPDPERWRVNTVFILLALALVPQFFPMVPAKVRTWLGVFALTLYPVLAAVLLMGGLFGLPFIETSKWGGLMLTLVLSYVGIVVSLPVGTLLALGRRSGMPIIRTICVLFIELWRGVPLISVLFMASVMLPLFLPDGVNFDKLLRALIGISMFWSAYMAEVVRGGLQGIPKGQYEAAAALGLGYWKATLLVTLPQALKLVIPGIVNTFIALFKDTTLVLIIGLFDILGAVQSAIVDPAWGHVAIEGYVFAALCFWVFCFGMSQYSQGLERKLHTGHKR